jgi:hypothetical protein
MEAARLGITQIVIDREMLNREQRGDPMTLLDDQGGPIPGWAWLSVVGFLAVLSGIAVLAVR